MAKPIYMEIAEDIKGDIIKGNIKPGEFIPSENTLSSKYSVNRITVRKALALLVNENIIESIPGKGSFVKSPINGKYELHFPDDIRSVADDAQLLKVDLIEPNIQIVYNLNVTEEDKVVVIKRLLKNEGEAVAYEEKYLPYYPGIPIVENEIGFMSLDEMVAADDSPYSYKKELIISAGIADAELSEYLDVEEGSALIIADQKIIDENYQSVGWGRSFFRCDKFKFRAVSML